jgi:membrane protease YdiL (CAAX protease family)
VIALAFIWIMQAPAVLAKLGVIGGAPEDYGGLTALGIFSPLIAATCCAWREARGRGVRELYAQLLRWRAGLPWYVATLFGPPLLLAAGVFLFDATGERPYFYPPDQPARVVALFLVPIVEELGWRGYALPRLLDRYRPIAASLIVGVCWWAWHATMFTLQDFNAEHFALGLLLLTSGSIVYTWLYLISGGGLTIALVAHASAQLSNSNIVLPKDSMPFIVQTAGFCLAALVVVGLDRKTFHVDARRPRIEDTTNRASGRPNVEPPHQSCHRNPSKQPP